MLNDTLSQQLNNLDSQTLKLARNNLKDQVTGLLRNAFINGQISPGTKLVERDIAQSLSVSRAPVRDALMHLEDEGFVISKPNGRYVVELTERDIYELYQVRLVMEKLAVELAIQHSSPEHRTQLSAKLQEMKDAANNEDADTFTSADIETHRLIWLQANNLHLFKTLNRMTGPLFMFISKNTRKYNWKVPLELHEDLVACINASDVAGALNNIERHLDNARQRWLRHFESTAKPAE